MADPTAPPAPPAPPAAGDRYRPTVPVSLEESARRLGHYRWIEMRVFELMGGWVQVVPELEVKDRLAVEARHHAWHADLWLERLPVLAEMGADRLTVPPDAGLVAFVEALGELEQPETTIEKLVGVYRVLLPRKIAAYTFHRDHSSPVCDAPTIRAFDLVLRDELDDWRDGELLLQSLLVTDDHVQRAADHQAGLEKLMVSAGGVGGPGGIGEPPG